MITEQQSEMIDYIIEGENKSNIAKLLGISRPTLYEWLKNKEVLAEKQRRLKEMKSDAKTSLTPKVRVIFDEIYKLATTCKDNRVKFSACKYICDQIIGSPTADKPADENINKNIEVTLVDDIPSIDDMMKELEEKERKRDERVAATKERE